MAGDAIETRMARIVDCAETHFALPVIKVTARGGAGRSSFRLRLPDREVIATMRPNFRRTHLEAFVLQSLSRYCDDVPQCLGVVGEIMFQSDVGQRRLIQDIVQQDKAGQINLAAQAVAGIFRFQAASRKTTLDEMVPHLGGNVNWVSNQVNAVDALQPYWGGVSHQFDRDVACAALARPPQQFVKWDCRAGNAAIGADDRLRWFDFEYAGMRHGAEDFAWLIGDEALPLDPDVMVDVMIDAFDPNCGHEIADYLEYLSIYLTFHCVQRFKLIVKEARNRGWLSTDPVGNGDDGGVSPDLAAQICRVGSYFADQSQITAPLRRNFDAARRAFLDIPQGGASLQSA
ncbi:MAG: hypothetical protein ACI8R4_002226 [Paracoccaceae bacterium]